ncbi:Deoxynucleoside triphosphate triphosphohydrolase SAMHD1-like protein [Bienertia sinuspersici]
MEQMRVLGDEICYPAKDYLTVYKLFSARADLYRTVYKHRKAVELMVADALVEANSYLEISSCIQDPSEYWKLDDTIIKTIETAPDQELKAKNLIQRIRRDFIRYFLGWGLGGNGAMGLLFCNEYAVPKDKLEHFKNVTSQDVICSQKSSGMMLKEDDIVVSNVKIALTRGTLNPLEQ